MTTVNVSIVTVITVLNIGFTHHDQLYNKLRGQLLVSTAPIFINKEMWPREAKLVLQFMALGR